MPIDNNHTDNGQQEGQVVSSNSWEQRLALTRGRFHVTPRGMQIAEAAAASEHRFGNVARQGKGWVELFVCLPAGVSDGDDDGGVVALEMPNRPSFYPAKHVLEHDTAVGSNDDFIKRGWNIIFLGNRRTGIGNGEWNSKLNRRLGFNLQQDRNNPCVFNN